MFLYLEKLYETSFKLSTIPNNVSVSSESSKIYGRFKKNTKTNIFSCQLGGSQVYCPTAPKLSCTSCFLFYSPSVF